MCQVSNYVPDTNLVITGILDFQYLEENEYVFLNSRIVALFHMGTYFYWLEFSEYFSSFGAWNQTQNLELARQAITLLSYIPGMFWKSELSDTMHNWTWFLLFKWFCGHCSSFADFYQYQMVQLWGWVAGTIPHWNGFLYNPNSGIFLLQF